MSQSRRRRRFNEEMRNWNPRRLLRENCEELLAVTFPPPREPSTAGAGENGGGNDAYIDQCAICYTYRLTVDGPGQGAGASMIPEFACGNPCCNRSYHETCLSEWLQRLPNASRSFSTIFGHCPYCQSPISVKVK